jgi:glycosyltransferase involved in cell wall biosynthesis
VNLPDVSVVIATRDRPEMMRQAVRSALEQEYDGSIQVVLVYDQSEPEAEADLLADLPVRPSGRTLLVTRNSRQPGLAGARNHGIGVAGGEIVAFCDDDDYWLPGKLTRQVELLVASPDASLVSCGIRVEYGEETFDRALDRRTITFEDLLRDRMTELHPSTFVMRREDVIDGFGLVDEQVPGSYGEDYEFLLRASLHGPVLSTPEPLTVVRWHRQSFFVRRWDTIADGLTWLLERYPQFDEVPAGSARVRGQIAFAHAAQGNRGAAARWAAGAARRNPLEARWALAMAVASGVVTPDRVLTKLHERGKGI